MPKSYNNEEDLEWAECRKRVDKKWGKRCIFEQCISITESKQIILGNPTRIDRCHILSRSQYPELKYNENNIVPLQRFIHKRMDEYRDPISNEYIDLNKHYYWWYRIHEKKIIKYDQETDYEIMVRKSIE